MMSEGWGGESYTMEYIWKAVKILLKFLFTLYNSK